MGAASSEASQREESVSLFDNHYYIKIRLNVDMETKSKSKVTKQPVR